MPLFAHEIQLRLPCDRSFDDMAPIAGGRHCDACDLTVQDVSALTEHEARVLLRTRHERRVCVAYRPLPDGTVRTAPERVVPSARLLRKARPAVFAAATLLAACGPAVDALPYSVQAKIPFVAEQALRHPVDFAQCVVSPACDINTSPAVAGGI